jgi:hypothetical protein
MIIFYPDGSRRYSNKDRLHRDNGPAVIDVNGSKFWYKNGKRHRIDGPALEYYNGYNEWYIDGTFLTEAEIKSKKAPHNGKKVTVDGIEYTLKA